MQNMRLFLAKSTVSDVDIQSTVAYVYSTLSSLRYVLQWSSVVCANYTV